MYKDRAFPCSICGKDSFKTLYDYGVFSRRITASVCKNCGLVCLNPRWSEERNEKVYQSEYYGNWLPKIKKGFDNKESRLHAGKVFNDLQSYITRDMKIIEVGCGEGYNLVVLKENGFNNLIGLEPSLDCYHKLSEYGIDCINSTLSNLDVDSWKFDCCILSGVLQQFTESQKALNTIHRVLKPDGVIFVSVPHYYGFKTYEQFIQYHSSYFSRVTLEMLLNNSGFIVDRYFIVDYYPESYRELALVARKSRVIPVTTNFAEYKRAVSYLRKNFQHQITQVDFLDCIYKHDSSSTFLFLDPPWYDQMYESNNLTENTKPCREIYGELEILLPTLKSDWMIAGAIDGPLKSWKHFHHSVKSKNKAIFGKFAKTHLVSNKPFTNYWQKSLEF